MAGSASLTARDLAALHRCAADGTLELLYQPEVELATGAIVAMEGLLRWHHGELGVLAPPAFLGLAERSGGMGAIGEWVLREGAAEAVRWQSLPGPDRRLWLNVSASQLVTPDFPDLVATTVTDAGLPAGALGLELTEATLLSLGATAAPLLDELRSAGVALAVDDFSSWFSTLGLLEALPLDAVKLDHRCVRGVGEQVGVRGSGDSLVAAVIEQAHDRQLYVVAEGVEVSAQAARLEELGCDRAHGWLFSSEQRADRARWLLARGPGWRGAQLTPDVQARPFLPTPRVSA